MNNELKIRKIDEGNWFWTDNDIFYKYRGCLSPSCILVYICLCARAEQETQSCYPSEDVIAHDIGMTSRTVSTYINRLIAYRFIYKERVRSARGEWLHNNYYLLNKSQWMTPQEIISYGNNVKTISHPEEKKDKNHRKLFPSNKTQYNKNKICKDEAEIISLLEDIKEFKASSKWIKNNGP